MYPPSMDWTYAYGRSAPKTLKSVTSWRFNKGHSRVKKRREETNKTKQNRTEQKKENN